jgi:hypothetical protein
MAYLQPVPTAPHPPIQAFNVNHRTRLTAVKAKDIKAFMAMLENEQTPKRTLTSEEEVALIDEEVKALIQSRLDRTLDNMGNRQFTEEFVHNWRKLPPIELCKQLLRTFKVDDKNVSLQAQLQAIPVPTVFNDPAQAGTFQSALVQLAKTHGDDYTFSRFLPVAEHREVIKEWLRLIRNQRTGGSRSLS